MNPKEVVVSAKTLSGSVQDEVFFKLRRAGKVVVVVFVVRTLLLTVTE